jgi:predicted O-methyltransferase YrrM
MEHLHKAAPLVSVATVVCNMERFLAESIESILGQTFRGFEFIIVDFGSTDGSQSIVTRYQAKDDRIKFHVILPCNLSEARNACCFRARGKYLALLDADDVALPHRLARQVDYLESHSGIGILGGGVELIDEAGRRVGAVVKAENDRELRKTLLNSSPFCASTVTMRADAFRAVGGYRRAFADTAEDYDLWQRIMEPCQGVKLGEVVVRYRLHPDQIGGRKLRQLSLGQCVARASARVRSQGGADPLNSLDSITPELLTELGISEEEVENALLKAYCTRVLNSLRASNVNSALPLVNEMLEALAQSKCVRDRVAADSWFTAARAYCWQGDVRSACVAVVRAAIVYPPFVVEIPWRGIRRVAGWATWLRALCRRKARAEETLARRGGHDGRSQTIGQPAVLHHGGPSLRRLFAAMAKNHAAFLGNVGRGWRTVCCCIRYLFVGARRGVPGLVDFVCADHFLRATQVASELAALGEILAVRRPEGALEIGTARGGTLLFLCRLANPQATIISVDLPSGDLPGYRRAQGWLSKRLARREQRVQLLQGDSHSSDMLGKVKAALQGQELSYLFIDGDHTYEGVKRDFEMYAGLVGKGGIIALHDIVEGRPEAAEGVPRFWRETKSQYRHTEIIEDRQQGGFGIGVLYVD